MKTSPFGTRRPALTALLLGSGLLLSFSGCATTDSDYGYYDQPVQVVQPARYVYYPQYEVYYNSARGTYVYYDNGGWVTRRDLPRRWAHNLRSSPSVYLDFSDAPERHHAEIARHYPRNWHGQQRRGGRPDDRDDRWNDDNGRR
ncbi:MAG: hypothetical protein ABIV50_06510 [Opitutus sp.]